MRKNIFLFITFFILDSTLVFANLPSHFGSDTPIQFAAVGDYGTPGDAPVQVATLIKSWKPDFIITLGDNNYPDGEQSTIDTHIGKLYSDYIYRYSGSYGIGSTYRRFFPSLGNHDWDCTGCSKSPAPYLQYFSMNDQQRYYDFTEGPVHFFALDSDSREPDGTTSRSKQALWLKTKLAQSTSAFNVVFFHHPPFSSGNHGNQTQMQWPFKSWGASAVLVGHDHIYERYSIDGIPYFVNGLGGRDKTSIGQKTAQCQAQYDHNYGAMRITASKTAMVFEFVAIPAQPGGTPLLIDRAVILLSG
jgi:hypothetical protein